jgi:hypothetical protein
MPEVLAHYDFRGPGRRGHDWGQYLDGRIHRLNAEDLDGMKPGNARERLYAVAAERGLKVQTEVGADFVVVRAYDPADDELSQAAA